MAGRRPEAAIAAVEVAAYTIPTDAPESDGTLEWDSTTLVLVQVRAGGETGIGYTYSNVAAATLIGDNLARVVAGRDALDIAACWHAMVHETRNLGGPGLTASAISAVDNALWDLKGKLLDVSVASLLGRARDAVPVYGSGGFTSYDAEQLTEQLAGWAEAGMRFVKMKVGREPATDVNRVAVARQAIGQATGLFVDANGGYSRKQALAQAERFAEHDVSWFEEPVSSEDLVGLRLMRDRGPAGMAISAGEYGYDSRYFRRMLAAGAVDVLQPDATRCGGITGFMRAAALAEAFEVPVSSHTAPALHVHACCAAAKAIHLEWFHDHARIERMLFDGAPQPVDGLLAPDLSNPGLGVSFKAADAERYRV